MATKTSVRRRFGLSSFENDTLPKTNMAERTENGNGSSDLVNESTRLKPKIRIDVLTSIFSYVICKTAK